MNKKYRHIEVNARNSVFNIEMAYLKFIMTKRFVITFSWSEYYILKKIRTSHSYSHYIFFFPIKD